MISVHPDIILLFSFVVVVVVSYVQFSLLVDALLVFEEDLDGLDVLLVDGVQQGVFRFNLQYTGKKKERGERKKEKKEERKNGLSHFDLTLYCKPATTLATVATGRLTVHVLHFCFFFFSRFKLFFSQNVKR